MKTSFWAPYISDHTVHAICWTLIHSLWIGLAIALLAGLVITITRKSTAVLRYNLLCGILVLFSISVYVTFWIEMRTPAIAHGSFRVGQVVYAPDNHIIIIPAATTPHLSFISRLVILLNEYSNVIFLAWLLFFVLKSLKMVGGLLYIQRIRNYKVHEISDEFKHKIDLFARQIGISQTVRLVQSELVKVPVAVGWLKPMILLPMGVILQLPAEQVESILWHELAHIRRRDYLVNILQGLVETVFFFNPGLLWLSSLIRAEREACCDDIVLSRMNRKANYLEALLAIADENNRYMSFAMGIGSGSQLRDRMKRMVNQENKRLSMAEKVVLIIGLVVLSAFTSLPKTTQAAVQHLFDAAIRKTDRITHDKVVAYSTPKQPDVQQKIELTIGDTIRGKSKTLAGFRSVLFKNSDADLANNDISAMDTTGKVYHFIVVDNKLTSMEINGEKVNESDLPKYQHMITEIDALVMDKRHIRQEDIAAFKAGSPAAKFKTNKGFEKRYADSMQVKAFGDSHWEKKWDSVKSKGFNGRAKMDDMSAARAKFDAMRYRAREDSVSYAGQKDRALNVIADLVHDKVLTDPASIKWFGLSDTEFIVNGQKQSDEMQQRYKAKYGVHEGYGLYYGPVQMHGTGVFIDVTDNKPPLPPRKPRSSKTPPEPRSGYRLPKYVDTIALINQQLIKKQQAFADDQNRKNQQMIKQQMAMLNEQNKKNHQFMIRQKALLAEQDAKQKMLIKEQAVQVTEAQKRDQAARQQQLDQQRRYLSDMQHAENERLKQLDWQRRYSSEQQLKMQQRAREFEERYKGTQIKLQNIMANVTDDLVSSHVLSDKSELVKFNLTNSALMVNGKKQPEELHEKLKAKYLDQPNYKFNPGLTADPNFGLHYNAQTGLQGLGVTDGPDSP